MFLTFADFDRIIWSLVSSPPLVCLFQGFLRPLHAQRPASGDLPGHQVLDVHHLVLLVLERYPFPPGSALSLPLKNQVNIKQPLRRSLISSVFTSVASWTVSCCCRATNGQKCVVKEENSERDRDDLSRGGNPSAPVYQAELEKMKSGWLQWDSSETKPDEIFRFQQLSNCAA